MTRLKEAFFLALGLLFLGFLFYNRAIREILPRDLDVSITQFRLCIYLLIILLNLLILIIMVYTWFKKSTINKDTFFKRVIKKVNGFYESIFSALGYLYKDFTLYIPWHHDMVLGLCKMFREAPLLFKRILLVSILILPKVIVLLAFLIDIFYFNRFNYFYKVIILLLIPLFVQFVYFLVKWVFIISERSLSSLIDVKSIGIGFSMPSMEQWEDVGKDIVNAGPITKVPLCEIKLKEEFQAEYDFNLVFREYELLRETGDSLDRCEKLRDSIGFYLIIILRIGYIIGWSYIIYMGLKHGLKIFTSNASYDDFDFTQEVLKSCFEYN